MDGHFYLGKPLTKGYTSIRMPGESVSVILVLDNDGVAYGDCCSSQYSGSGGRGRPFSASWSVPIISKHVKGVLEGSTIQGFRSTASMIDEIRVGDEALHPGILYGVTQALLEAVAMKRKVTMAEVVSEEYRLPFPSAMIPVHVQTGDDRYIGVDKAILKKADVLPQGLINTREKIGKHGEALLAYARWVADRVRRFGEKGYTPSIHFDTYGMIGKAFDDDLEQVTSYILRLEDAVNPFDLQIEMPIDVGEMKKQMSAFSTLKGKLKESGSGVMLVADEWANNLQQIQEWADSKATDIVHIKPTDIGSIDSLIRAVLYCKERGVGAYLGGTCNETDKSARVCAHVALATSPLQMSVKPGMAIDEGLMIIHNEMRRTLALIASKRL